MQKLGQNLKNGWKIWDSSNSSLEKEILQYSTNFLGQKNQDFAANFERIFNFFLLDCHLDPLKHYNDWKLFKRASVGLQELWKMFGKIDPKN